MAKQEDPTKREGLSEPFLSNWKEAVKDYRGSPKKTNQEIASALGISKDYFQAICYGQKDPGMETIIQAAHVFGVSPLMFTNHKGLIEVLSRGDIDEDRMKSVMVPFEQALIDIHKFADPVTKCELYCRVYREASNSHDPEQLPNIEEVKNLVRWAL
jgi:transcriptional regulator with XRE-family HTH domain